MAQQPTDVIKNISKTLQDFFYKFTRLINPIRDALLKMGISISAQDVVNLLNSPFAAKIRELLVIPAMLASLKQEIKAQLTQLAALKLSRKEEETLLREYFEKRNAKTTSVTSTTPQLPSEEINSALQKSVDVASSLPNNLTAAFTKALEACIALQQEIDAVITNSVVQRAIANDQHINNVINNINTGIITGQFNGILANRELTLDETNILREHTQLHNTPIGNELNTYKAIQNLNEYQTTGSVTEHNLRPSLIRRFSTISVVKECVDSGNDMTEKEQKRLDLENQKIEKLKKEKELLDKTVEELNTQHTEITNIVRQPRLEDPSELSGLLKMSKTHSTDSK